MFIVINSLVIVLAIIVSIIVIKYVKLQNNNYKFLFIFYTLFWIPIMMLRQYTSNISKILDPSFIYLWLPLCAYGFIGIFARPIADLISYKSWSRKTFIHIAIISQIITAIPFIIIPCTTTQILQVIGIGIGASSIGTFQLLFNEQYNTKKVFLTISILSIPPLLADFVSSAIQSTITSIYSVTISAFICLQIIALVTLCLLFVSSFFVKESKQFIFKDFEFKKQIKQKKEWTSFVFILLLGCLISFIKFANSDSIAQLQLTVLAKYVNNISITSADDPTKLYGGYLSLLFSFGQLVGGILVGLFLIKKIGKTWCFSIGCVCWIVYQILGIYIINPYGFLGIHILNGFSYGILYNLVLGFVLQKAFKTNKMSPMGVYQGVLSIGITCSYFFTSWLKSEPLRQSDFDQYFWMSDIINWSIIGAIGLSFCVFVFSNRFENKLNILR